MTREGSVEISQRFSGNKMERLKNWYCFRWAKFKNEYSWKNKILFLKQRKEEWHEI